MKLAVGEEGTPIPVSVNLEDVSASAGASLNVPISVSNTSGQAIAAKVEYLVQRDSSFYDKPEPHPLYGANVALGVKSWAEGKGELVVERNEVWGITNGRQTGINALTDGHNWTEFGTIYYNRDQWTEAFGYIDLGKPIRVVHLSADMVRQPDKTGKIDVAASLDGTNYTPVPGLQGIDRFTKGFGRVEVEVPEPFEARFIRLRLHHDEALVPFFRFPANVQIYGGIDERTFEFPQVGSTIASGTLGADAAPIAAGESATFSIQDAKPLEAGSYLVSVRVKAGDVTQLFHRHVYVAQEPITPSMPRFGVNVSDPANAEALRLAGAKKARFELRWPNVSNAADVYKFDGNAGDAIFQAYSAAGMGVVPVLLRTPEYLQSDEARTKKDAASLYPPTDPNRFGEFVFQTVARYGKRQHPADALLTADKRSGLGLLEEVELWNEPNTDNTRKTSWKGSLEDYYNLFRIGAEAAKRADPTVKVLNGGWSHFEVRLLETLRTHAYPDGRAPLDFVDVLSGHYFSYRVAPELATEYDISHHHEGIDYDRTVEADLRMAVAWRNQHKPTMPIRVSAAGHDSMDVEERLQAAWMPRGMLTALAAGVDEVLVYQDQGRGTFQTGATGIVREADRSLKPAWFTYATAIRELEGFKGPARRLPAADNARVYLWEQGDRILVTAWAVTGSAELGLNVGHCEIADAFGGKSKVEKQGPIALSEFPIYIRAFEDPAVVASLKAEADRHEQALAQQADRDRALTAYLFKFGKPAVAPVKLIGDLRPFTCVGAADTYDEQKGYGFIGPGLKEGRQQYYQHPLTEDSIGAPANTQFRFKASPGTYVIKLCTRPYEAAVEVQGVEGDPVTLKPERGGHFSEARVTIGQQPVTLRTTSNGGLVWLTVVQADDKGAGK